MLHQNDYRKYVGDLIWTLMSKPEVRKVIKFISPSFTIKASRLHHCRRNERQASILVTLGKPNYLEREVIALLQKCKEPFPVRKIGLKFWPKRKLGHAV